MREREWGASRVAHDGSCIIEKDKKAPTQMASLKWRSGDSTFEGGPKVRRAVCLLSFLLLASQNNHVAAQLTFTTHGRGQRSGQSRAVSCPPAIRPHQWCSDPLSGRYFASDHLSRRRGKSGRTVRMTNAEKAFFSCAIGGAVGRWDDPALRAF